MLGNFHVFHLLVDHFHNKHKSNQPRVSSSKSKPKSKSSNPLMSNKFEAAGNGSKNGSNNASGNGSNDADNDGNNSNDGSEDGNDDNSHKNNISNILSDLLSNNKKVIMKHGSIAIFYPNDSKKFEKELNQQKKNDNEKQQLIQMNQKTESAVKIKLLKSKLSQQHRDDQNKLTIQKLKDQNSIQKLRDKNKNLKLEEQIKSKDRQLQGSESEPAHYGPTNNYNIVFSPHPEAYKAVDHAIRHPYRYHIKRLSAQPSGHFITILPNSDQDKHPVGAGIAHPKMSTYSYDHDNQNPSNNDPKGPKDSGPSM